jgi:copper chaperone CopZ
MVKKTFRVEGMHCTSCALNIDEELEELPGVKCSKTSYARQLTEVEYDESTLNQAVILETIAKAGYTAREAAAK